jgi:molecular chaperone DnaJ
LEYYTCPKCTGGTIIDEACQNCNGKMFDYEEVDIDIRVPPGVGDGDILRISGYGNEFNSEVTDLCVRINATTSNDYFERKGKDVYTTNYVPLSFTVLGGEIKIKGLDGDISVKITKGVKDGDVIKLPKYGVDKLGDHYVNLKVVIPRIKNKINLDF